jgi:hypothetical protein
MSIQTQIESSNKPAVPATISALDDCPAISNQIASAERPKLLTLDQLRQQLFPNLKEAR